MKTKNPDARYFTWRDNTERIMHACNRLKDDIDCTFHSDKDLENFNTLLELLETACDFATTHLTELRKDYERWLDNL